MEVSQEPFGFERKAKGIREKFPSQRQRDLAKKPVKPNEQDVQACRGVLTAFFEEMTSWEQFTDQVGFDDPRVKPRLLAIWEKFVSEVPRAGFRPLALSYSPSGTYRNDCFLDAERITKNKLLIYTRDSQTDFTRRFLMKRTVDGWKIDALQERLDGWLRVGL